MAKSKIKATSQRPQTSKGASKSGSGGKRSTPKTSVPVKFAPGKSGK